MPFLCHTPGFYECPDRFRIAFLLFPSFYYIAVIMGEGAEGRRFGGAGFSKLRHYSIKAIILGRRKRCK